MGYSNKQIATILDAAKNEKVVTHITDKSKLSLDDRFKLGLCKHFVQYSVEHDVSLTEMSKMTGLPTSRLSEITNYKIKNFTASQLLKNLEILAKHDKRIQQYASLLEQVAEAPTLSIKGTRKVSRELEKTVAASL